MDESILQNTITQEKEYGVEWEKIEKKYIFSFEDDNEGEMEVEDQHQPSDKLERTVTNEFTSSNNSSNDKLESSYIPQSFITPSRHHGISHEDELRLRAFAIELIIESCYALKLPWYTSIAAQSIFHRFYYRVSFLDHDIKDSIMACIFVATKVEESPRKLRDIVTVFHHILKLREGRQESITVLDPSSEYYHFLRSLVIECERYVLKELGFELYRLTEYPHSYLLDYLKRLKTSKEVAKKAWNYLNDSYRRTLCVHYPPHILAASCVYLAIRSTNSPMPKTIWWAIFDTSIKHILEVCGEILYLYEQSKTDMKGVKEILDACYKLNKQQKEYTINSEDIFQQQKRGQRELEKKDENKERSESKRESHSRRSPKYSRDNNGYRDRRIDSRDRRDRSPRGRKRRSPSPDKSRDKGRRKYSRTPSPSDKDGKRRKDKERSKDKHPDSSGDSSPSEKRKRSSSEHKKKKRDRSKEKRKDKEREKDREKEKERERERDKDRDRDEKNHKHRKDDRDREKDKHKDKYKDKERDTDRKKNRDKENDSRSRRSQEKQKVSTERNKAESQDKKDNEKQQKQKIIEEEREKDTKVEDKNAPEQLPDFLLALKQEILSKKKSSYSTAQPDVESKPIEQKKEKIVEENTKKSEEKEAGSQSDSDEDDEKLLELKKKILEKKNAMKK